MHRVVAVWLALAAPAALADTHCLGQGSAKTVLQVSVVPQFAPTVLHARWAPLLERIGQKTGQCFRLSVSSSIPEFERDLLRGEPDLAFVNPYHAVMARRAKGYVPLVRDDRQFLSGVVVVRGNSEIRSLADLRGQVVAFPAPNAFAASLLVRAQLAAQQIDIQPRYMKNHGNVYRAVALAEVTAGGGVNNTLQREEAGLRARLRVLYETPRYAAHPMVAHPRVPAALRAELIAAFIEQAAQADGRSLLEAVQMPQPIAADYARDYAPLEALNLERFVVLGGD
ncbi:MAG: phosphate/phosphite/phosphonate ABC transporter substrate-binding protein [Betaproteobacteria bacterium]